MVFMMQMLVHWCISIAVIFFYVSTSNAVCDHIITRDDDIYILSAKPKTYQKAEETCQSYRGNLAQISSQDEREFFETHLRRFLIPDEFVKVYIQSKETNYGNRSYDLYKYRPEDGLPINDNTSLSGFTTPEENELQSIMLYKRSLTNFNEAVQFCWYDGRDAVRVFCKQGWKNNFQLYGGKLQTSRTIKVYNYLVKEGASGTSKFSLTEIEDSFFLISPSLPHFYLPDISVFTGTQSDVGQSNWFWNNRTMIPNTTFYPANTSICQQMTWPLTYDDGINLRAKECGSGESHYICEAKELTIEASVEEVDCDGTSLLLYFPNNTITFLYGTIQVKISDGRSLNIPIGSSSITIGNFTQRTNYSFQLEPLFKGCSVGPIITVTGRTGYGIPDKVTLASAINSTSNICLVSWRRKISEKEELRYKITSTSNVTNESTTVNPSSIPGEAQDLVELMIHQIDLSGHGYDNVVSFEIQTVSSCGKMSESVVVNGNCISPMEPQSAGLSTYAIIGIIVGVAVMLILVLLILLVWQRKSNQRNIAAMNMPEIANHPTIYEEPINVGQAVDETNVQPNSSQNYECFTHSNIYVTVEPNAYENVA